jgi:hypothetical protein
MIVSLPKATVSAARIYRCAVICRAGPGEYTTEPARVPTYRFLYVPPPAVRLLIEDVEADTLVQTPLHWVLTCDVLVVGRPRENRGCAGSAARRDRRAAGCAWCPRDGAAYCCRPGLAAAIEEVAPI